MQRRGITPIPWIEYVRGNILDLVFHVDQVIAATSKSSLHRHSLYDSLRCSKTVGHAPACRCFWHELKYAELRISLLIFLVIFAFFSRYQNWSLEAQGCTVESFRRFLKMKWALVSHAGLTLLVCIGLGSCNNNPNPSLVDDAGGRKPEDLPEIAEDRFKPMDWWIELSTDWQTDRYYNATHFAVDPKLIRTYRVGIS